VDLEPVKAVARPVPLAEIKADVSLREIPLVRQQRLSVMPLPAPAFERILVHGKTKLR
jgi:predicted RNA-binding protein with PUA-like domain